MKPLQNRLLIKKLEEEKEIGGIIIQTPKQEASIKCEVLEIGPKVEFCKIGSIILLSKYSGVEVKGGLIVKEDDVLGIIT
jgi:co-chaperonin GroES (HSP10)